MHAEASGSHKRPRESDEGRNTASMVNRASSADIIDLTKEDDEPLKDDEPIVKSSLPFDVPPVHLMHVQNLQPWANEGFLGIQLGDVVCGKIEWALISNYKIDLSYLLTACPDLKKAGELHIVHGMTAGHLENFNRDVKNEKLPNLKSVTHKPLTKDFGVHHTKAFLLKYATGLRVVIYTANILPGDLNYKTQSLFYQDFPAVPPGSRKIPLVSPFEDNLATYLKALKLPVEVAQAAKTIVQQHDFSSARVHLIISTRGNQSLSRGSRGGESSHVVQPQGHMQLRQCVKDEYRNNNASTSRHKMVAQYSSLGRLDAEWLKTFSESLNGGAASLNGHPIDRLSLIWPTFEEVANSNEGLLAAGASLPHDKGTLEKEFMRRRYCRYGGEVVGRELACPHIKSYVCFDESTHDVLWYSVASHNLSKAAWGEPKEGRTPNNGRPYQYLYIRSFELGVLMVPSLEKVYRCSAWYGFSCTDDEGPVREHLGRYPVEESKMISEVKFVQWQHPEQKEAHFLPSNCPDKTLVVPLPIPYALPPHAYQVDDIAFGHG